MLFAELGRTQLVAERLGVKDGTVRDYLWGLQLKLGTNSSIQSLWKLAGAQISNRLSHLG
jgi:hypothetical protein